MSDIVNKVHEVILSRKAAPPEESYVAKLFSKGEDKILQKVGEEAVEVLLAAKSGDDDALVYELTDLLFHSMVLLAHKDISPERIEAELERRFGVSGIEEKKSRGK